LLLISWYFSIHSLICFDMTSFSTDFNWRYLSKIKRKSNFSDSYVLLSWVKRLLVSLASEIKVRVFYTLWPFLCCSHFIETTLFHTVDSRYLDLGYLELCETRSVFLIKIYILIAFSTHNLALESFLQVQITRSANWFALRVIWTCKNSPYHSRYRELAVFLFYSILKYVKELFWVKQVNVLNKKFKLICWQYLVQHNDSLNIVSTSHYSEYKMTWLILNALCRFLICQDALKRKRIDLNGFIYNNCM